jgi:chromosome partitioning protein
MKGKAIMIGGEKGGTGKSTIAVNLAVMASLMNHDILLLDTDKQGSSRNFIEHRNETNIKPTPPCVQIRGKHLHSEIENLISRYQFVIIDAGGKDSVELRSGMACSSVTDLYSPLQPSEFDLETLSTMDELTYLSLSYNSTLRTHIVLNQCPTHSKITVKQEAIDIIGNFENLRVAKSNLGHRVAFSYAKSQHLSVVEFEHEKFSQLPTYQAKKYVHKASDEIISLYEEIFNEDFTAISFKTTTNINELLETT